MGSQRLRHDWVMNWTEPNLICWIIDFQGTCDPCCYCVLLLRPPVWKHLAWLRAKSYCMEVPSLARSRKLPRHIWEQGRTLAPWMCLRLEGTLLAACLRGQWPESESLSWLCLGSICTEALLVTMRFLRTQIRNCSICSDWICNGPLPLVVLAFSRWEKVLHWLLSQLLRYSFEESVEMNWKYWP